MDHRRGVGVPGTIVPFAVLLQGRGGAVCIQCTLCTFVEKIKMQRSILRSVIAWNTKSRHNGLSESGIQQHAL